MKTSDKELTDTFLEPMVRLDRDIKEAAKTLSRDEARFLVDSYYALQKFRIASDHQVRSLAQSNEPHLVLSWFGQNANRLETGLQRALDTYSNAQVVGRWARSIVGIGPVIASGLLAHIDIEKAPTVGHIWRFAGLDPTCKWGKGERRPWNADLKVLCWKIGQSFVKVSANENDIYGKIWRARKDQELQRNEQLLFKSQADEALRDRKLSPESKEWYDKGMLPPGRIELRAERYAVKLFLAHYHWVAYEDHFNKQPPNPYVIDHMQHVHMMKPPNWPMS